MAGEDDGEARLASPPGPAVGLDLGDVRIGVAATDSARTVATPRQVFSRTGDRAQDDVAIIRIIEELGASLVVVGLPLSLDGTKGPAARRVADEADHLADLLQVPVVLADERFSTVEATRKRREVTARRRQPRRATRPIDAEAAAVILQAYIDGARR